VADAWLRLQRASKGRGDEDMRRVARRFLVAMILPAATIGVLLASASDARLSATLAEFIGGLWRLALPLLVAYGLVRHHIFDIDVKLKWTIGSGTLAGFFLAVFFVVAQLVQNALGEVYGWLVGGIAAGLLLFALSPLQRLAEQVAHAALPGAKPIAAMNRDERLLVYRDTARVVWADGAIDRNERAMLDRLRETLGLTREEASVIESEAAVA
jgi:hypothetical protein